MRIKDGLRLNFDRAVETGVLLHDRNGGGKRADRPDPVGSSSGPTTTTPLACFLPYRIRVYGHVKPIETKEVRGHVRWYKNTMAPPVRERDNA